MIQTRLILFIIYCVIAFSLCQAFPERFIYSVVLYTALLLFRCKISRKFYIKRFLRLFPIAENRSVCKKSHDVVKTVVIFRNLVVRIHCISYTFNTYTVRLARFRYCKILYCTCTRLYRS